MIFFIWEIVVINLIYYYKDLDILKQIFLIIIMCVENLIKYGQFIIGLLDGFFNKYKMLREIWFYQEVFRFDIVLILFYIINYFFLKIIYNILFGMVCK